MIKVMVANKNVIEIGIMVGGCSRLIRAFWVYEALVYEDRRKV